MLDTILFCLSLALSANEASLEMEREQHRRNECLLAKECIAVYDADTHSWIVRPVEKQPQG
jgi:hypothetical protein